MVLVDYNLENDVGFYTIDESKLCLYKTLIKFFNQRLQHKKLINEIALSSRKNLSEEEYTRFVYKVDMNLRIQMEIFCIIFVEIK